MQPGHKAAYECIKAFSEMDFTEELNRRKNYWLRREIDP